MKKAALFIFVVFSLIFVQNPIFAQEKTMDDLYVYRLKNRVELNWIIPESSKDKSALVTFTINDEGDILYAEITKSSGDKAFDASALASIYKAAPFERLPECTDDTTPTFEIFFSSKTMLVQRIDEISKTNSYGDTLLNNNPDLTYTSYFNNLQDRVKSNWNPTIYQTDKVATMVFNINKDGSISDLHLIRSSGDTGFDTEAIKSINNSKPFDIFPDDIEENFIKVQFSFYFNALRSAQSNTYATSCCLANDSSKLITDYENYKNKLETILNNSLPQDRYYRKKGILLTITIDKNGSIANLVVKKPSKNQKFDKKIISIVKKCPFPSIPNSLNTKYLTFDYGVSTQKNTYSIFNINFWGRLTGKELKSDCIWN